MKTITKNFLVVTIIMIFSFTASAQKESKTETIEIKTSIQCEQCEERIMDNLPYEKGIKEIKVDIPSKVVTVTFRKGKTTADKVRKAIAKIGYDADDVPADPEAYAKLPKCCQKGGHD